MPTKDDPLDDGGHTTYKGRTLWLGKENVELARDNFWRAYNEHSGPRSSLREDDDKATWDIAWAAAVAVYSYIMEGRVEPPS